MITPIKTHENSTSQNRLAMHRFLNLLKHLDCCGPVDLNEDSGYSQRDVRLLHDEGLIYGTGFDSGVHGFTLSAAVLTPKGALTAYEWDSVIKENSSQAKLWKGFTIVASVTATIAIQLAIIYSSQWLGLTKNVQSDSDTVSDSLVTD